MGMIYNFLQRILDVLIPYNKPIIRAVDGAAIGIGATLTQHCDLVYASKEAKFLMPFVNLGLNPEAATSFVLPKLVGYHNLQIFYFLEIYLLLKEHMRWALLVALLNKQN